MFALDWIEFPENDDHLPLAERAWHQRLMERVAAAERFEREYPDVMKRLGRAAALLQQERVIQLLTEEG